MSRRQVDALARLRSLPDAVLGLLVEAALAELDARHGDGEDETDDHAGCEVEDVMPCSWLGRGAGDADDAEDGCPPASGPIVCRPLLLQGRA